MHKHKATGQGHHTSHLPAFIFWVLLLLDCEQPEGQASLGQPYGLWVYASSEEAAKLKLHYILFPMAPSKDH